MNEKSFEQFVEEVKDTILSYLPMEYEGSRVEVSTKSKVNKDATGISVIPAGVENAITPLVNLDGFYERYKQGTDMDTLLTQMSECFTEAFESLNDLPFANNPMEQMDKDNIYMQLINRKSNEDYLSTLPHRDFHDMSIIYRVLMDKSEEGIQSVVITNDLAETMELTEDELFERASTQTKELFPVKIDTMGNVLRGFLGDGDIPDELMDDMSFNESLGMYIISNDMSVNGATYMVYDDVLFDVASRLNENLYILPSSIHEFLAVPESIGDPETLSEMVRDINAGTVKEVDRLSNQVFMYDKDLRELTQVSDTPILGIKDEEYKVAAVAEPVLSSYEAPVEGRAR